MGLSPKAPLLVRIIGWILVVEGAASAIETAIQLFHRHLQFNLGFIWIFAGLGLLRLKNGWRRFAIAMAIFDLAMGLPLLGLLGDHGWPERWSFFRVFPFAVTRAQGFGLLGISMLLDALALMVLLSPKVRNVFSHRIAQD